MKHSFTFSRFFSGITLTIALLSAQLVNAQLQGNALNFTSTSDVMVATVPVEIGNLSTTDVTFDYWVKLDATGSTGRIFFAQSNASNFVSVLLNGSGQVYFYVNYGSSYYSHATSTTLTVGQWVHVAHIWHSGTLLAETYFNGVLQTTAAGGTSSTSTDGILALGAKADGSQSMAGSLDEFRFWSVAKSPCEITAMMSSLYSATAPNLVTCYRLDEGTAGGNNAGVTTANALVGNNGTLNGFTLSGSNSNWVNSGASISVIDATNSVQATDVQSACGSYVWMDGNTYTSSNNTATYTVTGTGACDTTYTLDLTILQTTSSTDVQQACGSYIWIDGNTYTSSNNTATYVIPNVAGCDSTITLDLTILQPTTSTDVLSSCGPITWLDGNTYSSNNNTATFLTTNAAGCDSLITLDLTIVNVDVTVANNSPVLTANSTTGTYQWIDCDNGNAPITGATLATFTPSANGNYAVIVTESGCSDTSACQLVDNVGVISLNAVDLVLYPNPNSTGVVKITYSGTIEEIRAWDAAGREITNELTVKQNELDLQSLQNGWYSIMFKTTDGICYRSLSLVK